jgi:hypothetical protein
MRVAFTIRFNYTRRFFVLKRMINYICRQHDQAKNNIILSVFIDDIANVANSTNW